MKKIIFILIGLMLFSACNINKKKYEEYYFIPNGYTGWINIIYGDTASSNKVIHSGNAYFHFIVGNPIEYSVSSKIFPEGYYTSHFYYYSTDTMHEIFDETHQKIQVFRKGTMNFASSKSNYLSAKDGIKIVNFYVSSKAVTSVYDINIPENSLGYLRRKILLNNKE